jgi:hypothetical protein
MDGRRRHSGGGRGPLLVLTLMGMLAAVTACSSGESSGGDGDAGADEAGGQSAREVPGATWRSRA